ncbi:MAG TPA: hypothetical protein VNZ94_01830 [Xanthobacteraceae bacterium]|nr:hypothetical protein [Xanthobacteraceae bacterium]
MRLPEWLRRRLHERIERIASKRAPDFVIGGPEDPYLKRWWVIPRNRFFNVYLHHFLRSDDDRALHDHPWWNASILIVGGYVEHTINAGGVNVRTEYSAGAVKLRGARAAHRIELDRGPCWTIFITGPRLREWGFHCPHGWRPWQQFVSSKDAGEVGRGCD